jgi:hypothetical protein
VSRCGYGTGTVRETRKANVCHWEAGGSTGGLVRDSGPGGVIACVVNCKQAV